MVLARIIVKNEYEEKGDLVFRPLIRSFIENGISLIVDNNKAMILGLVQDDVFYELSTWKPIHYSGYEIISSEEFGKIIDNLSVENLHVLRKIINELVFYKNDDMHINPGMIEELARDRGIEFTAYNESLSIINPYEEPYNGYNDFMYKCQVLEDMKANKRVK